ncbi:MAG: OprO/OprP family phosphate-selective porin [Sphingomonadaceae bacterium]|nr:porin [Thermaurantiacus sp.]MCS6986861.1 OprO/OprP family phosphate-selective porin [Sphingomonadaceae bacterium]MDW8415539.1 porin [Thermaurantiacus sp.]
MEELERRVEPLEARNRKLEAAQAEVAQALPVDAKGNPIKPAVMVKAGPVPTIGDPEARFTFESRGVIDFDFAAYIERDTAFDYLAGTNVRRAGIGLEGTGFRQFAWRIEADFAGSGKAELTDAYLQFTGLKNTSVVVGQFKVPFGFDQNSSDNSNTFLEASLMGNSFGAAAGRRIGIGIDWVQPNRTPAVAFSGDNNAASRLDERSADGSRRAQRPCHADAREHPTNPGPGRRCRLLAVQHAPQRKEQRLPSRRPPQHPDRQYPHGRHGHDS